MAKYILNAIFVFTFGFAYSNAQSKLSEKLDDVKGKIDKITIHTDEGDVVFEGKDAEKLFGRMKNSKQIKVRIDNDGESDNSLEKKIIIKRSPNDSLSEDFDLMEFNDFDDDEMAFGSDSTFEKKIIVKNENGGKKVTVTTIENGKEKTKVYEGDEADKFIKEHQGDKEFNIKIENGDKNKKIKKIIIEKEEEKD